MDDEKQEAILLSHSTLFGPGRRLRASYLDGRDERARTHLVRVGSQCRRDADNVRATIGLLIVHHLVRRFNQSVCMHV